MNKLLLKIFQNVICYERTTMERNKIVDEEINLLIEPYKEKLCTEQIEELKNLLSSIALTAEQTGFEIGAQFVIKLLYTLLLD